MKQYLEIGRIVAVQGLKGEVRVEPWCDEPEFLCGFDELYLENGKKSIVIEYARRQKNIVVMKLDGIETAEQAQLMRGKILYMDRNDVELDEGVYFFQDLIGLETVDSDSGEVYGRISDITRTGANDVYTVTFPDGKEKLIPAIPDVVRKIDAEGGKIYIHVLEGLFDED